MAPEVFAGAALLGAPAGSGADELVRPPAPAAAAPEGPQLSPPSPLPPAAPLPLPWDPCANVLPVPDPQPKPPDIPTTLAGLAKKLDAVAGNITVSSGDETFKLLVFGALQANMLYNSARPVAPGTIFFLTEHSPFGLSTQTIDVHARSTTLGLAFSGPKVCGFETGGLVLACLYNDALI